MRHWDRQARNEYRELVRNGMGRHKAAKFVEREMRLRLEQKASLAIASVKRGVWARASKLQREAEERGEYLNRQEALRLAARP